MLALGCSVQNYDAFAMLETCENRLHSWVYYDRRTWEICQVLPYSVDFKAPGQLKLKSTE